MTTEIAAPVPETLPAAAAEPQDPQAFLDKASPAETLEWRKTGKFPTEPKPAASAPAKESSDSGAAAPDKAAPASEPGKPQQEKKKQQTAEERKAQLQREIQELTAERNRLKNPDSAKPDVRQDAAPSPVAQPVKAENQPPAKPKMDDKNADGTPKYKTYGEWEDAKDQWIEDRATEKAAARLKTEEQQKTQQAEEQEAQKTWKTRVDATAKSIPDFTETISAAIDAKHPIFTKVPTGSVLEHFIYRVAEHGPEVLYHFVKTPGEFERILGIRDRFTLDRELFKIDNSFASASAEPEKKTLPAPKVTDAPPPARTLAGRGTKPADEVAAAVRDGDFATYKASANAREIAARKGTR